uniref:NADH dehydrogenase [ubiquinone] 1 alpha subcomplex subunit 13 n=1 Tax=Amphora coffeiformis TaxID=265554 RepID=A0A7S3LFL8_9STRA
MSFRPDMKNIVQDMPPPGGFPKINWNAQLRSRGPSGFALWAGATALILYGFTRVGATNKESSAEKLLERQARYAMAPILQEEEDRKYLAAQKEVLKKEAEILQGATLPPIYLSDRWAAQNTNPMNKNKAK